LIGSCFEVTAPATGLVSSRNVAPAMAKSVIWENFEVFVQWVTGV